MIMRSIAHFLGVLRLLFWNADTTTFRLIFSAASFSLGFFMMVEPSVFQNPGLRLMGELAPYWLWATLFFAHGALVMWRFVDPTPRVHCSLAINCFGFAIWTAYVVLQDVSVGHFAVNSSAERVLVIFSFWSIVRTGTRREVVTP